MNRESKVYLEYCDVLNIPKYKVKKLVNKTEPTIGEYLTKEEVNRLIRDTKTQVIITKLKR